MLHNAIFIKFDDYVEEEVIIEINGVKLNCFIGTFLETLEKGKKYQVELNLEFMSELHLSVLKYEQYSAEKIDEGFAYRLCGKVEKGELNIGNDLKISNDLFNEYVDLDGKFIEIFVDRIFVDFDPWN